MIDNLKVFLYNVKICYFFLTQFSLLHPSPKITAPNLLRLVALISKNLGCCREEKENQQIIG